MNIKISGLVNNSNMLHDTSIQTIKASQKIINEVVSKTKIPLVCTCVMENIYKINKSNKKIFEMHKY
jgi:hypothetical protein